MSIEASATSGGMHTTDPSYGQTQHWSEHLAAILFVSWLAGWFLACLLNVPATCYCISGTDLVRQVYVLPHRDRSGTSNFLTHLFTVY